MTTPDSHITVTEVDEILVARFTEQPRFPSFALATVFDGLLPKVEGCPSRCLLVDLSEISYLDSSSLGELSRLQGAIDKLEGKLAMCCVQESLREILNVLRLDRLFAIYPDEATARQALLSGNAE